MKFIIAILISVYSLFACGYSLSLFNVDPNKQNIQMLLEKEMIHIKQVTSNHSYKDPNNIYEIHNLKFGEKPKETNYKDYHISFYAVVDKDIHCYDFKHAVVSLETKKSGDGMFEPSEKMINIHSICFPNKEELNSFMELNKKEIIKQKIYSWLENSFFPMLFIIIGLIYLLVWFILFLIKKISSEKFYIQMKFQILGLIYVFLLLIFLLCNLKI